MEMLNKEDYMIKVIDLNPIVKRFVNNQIKVFNEHTDQYVKDNREELSIAKEAIYRAERFLKLVRHLEDSLDELFYENTYTMHKFISEDWKNDSLIYTITIIDKDHCHVTSVGFQTANDTRRDERFFKINKYFGGKR